MLLLLTCDCSLLLFRQLFLRTIVLRQNNRQVQLEFLHSICLLVIPTFGDIFLIVAFVEESSVELQLLRKVSLIGGVDHGKQLIAGAGDGDAAFLVWVENTAGGVDEEGRVGRSSHFPDRGQLGVVCDEENVFDFCRV